MDQNNHPARFPNLRLDLPQQRIQHQQNEPELSMAFNESLGRELGNEYRMASLLVQIDYHGQERLKHEIRNLQIMFANRCANPELALAASLLHFNSV